MANSFTLYGNFVSGPAYKAGLMLSLCGIDFTYRHVDLAKGQHKTPDYLAINRFGQVPSLVHDGRTIVQSDVILLYLAEVTGKFGGQTAEDRWKIQEMQHWEADRLHPAVGRLRFFTRFLKQEPPVMDLFRKNTDMALSSLDGLLAGRTWLVGDAPSVADISCYAVVQQAPDAKVDLGAWSNIAAWCMRVEALPGYRSFGEALPKADRD
jgi:glutathione S-transferase